MYTLWLLSITKKKIEKCHFSTEVVNNGTSMPKLNGEIQQSEKHLRFST